MTPCCASSARCRPSTRPPCERFVSNKLGEVRNLNGFLVSVINSMRAGRRRRRRRLRRAPGAARWRQDSNLSEYEIEDLLIKREQARVSKDMTADAIREELRQRRRDRDRRPGPHVTAADGRSGGGRPPPPAGRAAAGTAAAARRVRRRVRRRRRRGTAAGTAAAAGGGGGRAGGGRGRAGRVGGGARRRLRPRRLRPWWPTAEATSAATAAAAAAAAAATAAVTAATRAVRASREGGLSLRADARSSRMA